MKPAAERFTANTKVLLDLVQACLGTLKSKGFDCPDPAMVNIAKSYIDIQNPETIIEKFIQRTHEDCWTAIMEKNEEHFIENASKIFSGAEDSNINMFKDIFKAKDSEGDSVISENIKNKAWKILNTLVKICVKYIHEKRGPYIEDGKKFYSNKFMPEVKHLSTFVRNHDIKIEWPEEISS